MSQKKVKAKENSECVVVFASDGVVTLRPPLKKDLPFMLSCVNDPSIRPSIGRHLPMTEEAEEAWLKRLCEKQDTDIVFIIEVDGKPIGTMGIHRINQRDRVATTGAMIKSSDHRGKGYGTRAKMLLLYYAFYECNLHKICSNALVDNTASLRFNEKCGYKREGHFKKHAFRNGEYVDIIQTAVFREDFDPLWKIWKEHHKLEM